MAKASKGSVAVEKFRDRVRLRWRYRGKRLSMTVGDAGNKVTWTVARKLAQQLEGDLLTGNYDETQAKYRPDEDRASELLVVALFASFQLAKGMTQDSKYKALLGKLKNSAIGRKEAGQIFETDAKTFFAKLDISVSTKRSYLYLLRACWNDGQDKKWLNHNPWNSVDLGDAEPDPPAPFDRKEVEKILEAFKKSYYLNWVIALFSLGCRPGELAALTWADVKWEQRSVQISKSWNSKKRILKKTKTNKIRFTPINESFAQLLILIKPEDAKPTDLVFPSPEGGYLNVDNFLKRHWKPTLEKLDIPYRPQYNTRHTVWSHAVIGTKDRAPMPIAEAAKCAGNRVETMIRHYLGSVTSSEMPDLISGVVKD